MEVEIAIRYSDDRPCTVTVARPESLRPAAASLRVLQKGYERPVAGSQRNRGWLTNLIEGNEPACGDPDQPPTARAASLDRMARLRLTLEMNSGARIGPGKAELLASVQSSGSISAAARAMGMDYKRAWLLMDSLNRAFAIPAVERVTGGPGGGGAVLTPFGADLLARYRRLEAAAAELATAELEALEQQAAPDPGPKV